MSESYWISLGVFIAFTAVIVLVRRWLLRGAKPGEDACGHCGYLVQGLPSSICPECGSDVEIVGTRRPSWWLNLPPSTRRNIALLVWVIWSIWAYNASMPFYVWFVVPGTYCYGEETSTGVVGSGPQPRVYVTAMNWMSRGTPHAIQADGGKTSTVAGWRICLPIGAHSAIVTKTLYQLLGEYHLPDPDHNSRSFFVDAVNLRYASQDPDTGEYVTRRGDWGKDLDDWLATMESRLGARPGTLRARASTDWSQAPPPLGPLPSLDLMASGFVPGGAGPSWSPDARYTMVADAVAFIALVTGIVVIIRRSRRGALATLAEAR